MKLVTEREVNGILNSMKCKTSTGPDDLSSKLIKPAALAIVSPLTKLINRCFETGYFPESMKIAKVLPIFKTGDINNFENNRPISLLPVISKVIERAIYNRMVSYIHPFNLLNSNQIGFRQKFKTIDALACVTEQIREPFNCKTASGCVSFDPKKTFDTINHDNLLNELIDYGFRGPILTILKSYLDCRKQFLQIGNDKSSMRTIH